MNVMAKELPKKARVVIVGGGPMQRRVSSVVYHVDVVLVVLDYFFAQF